MTLQDIADDAGVTPALVNRYFVSKRALFDLVAQSRTDEVEPLREVDEFAADLMVYWQDVDRRTPALALVRSVDLDGGQLLTHELERRIRGPGASSSRTTPRRRPRSACSNPSPWASACSASAPCWVRTTALRPRP